MTGERRAQRSGDLILAGKRARWTWNEFAVRSARSCWPWAKTPIARDCARRRTASLGCTPRSSRGCIKIPRGHLKKLFTQKYDEIVLIKDIRLVSFCEHHLLPVVGQGPRRLHSQRQGHRPVEDSARRRRAGQAAADAGALDRGGGRPADERARRPGRGRRDRGQPQLHDDPRGHQARQHVRHERHARAYSGKSPRPGRS